jgi:hypothetical protein
MTDRQLIITGAAVVLILLVFNSWILWAWRLVAIRQLNLQAFYYSQTCGDLPLGSQMNEQKCQEAMTKFMWPETGLFTR